MSTPIIAFFNTKGGVGKTSLVYHLAWMYDELGYRVALFYHSSERIFEATASRGYIDLVCLGGLT